MALIKREYTDKVTIITAENLNDIQDEIIQNGKDIEHLEDVIIHGRYDTSDYRDIIAAVRNGEGSKIPNGAVFSVPHAVYGDIDFVVRRKNVDKAVLDPEIPTLTIQTKYLLSVNGTSANTFQYDRPEAFYSVDTLIPAGTICKFTTIAYGGWAAGTYHFTADADIPVGSKLCMSGYESTAMTSSYVRVFASAKATTHSAQYAIASGDGGATLDLGTWGTDLNHPQRISYGSNNAAQSNVHQFLNGDSGNGFMSDIFVPQTKYDMMATSFTSLKGFLGGFPDEFRQCLALAEIKNIANNAYEEAPYVKNTAYTYNGYFWLPSRKEIYGTNENSNEDNEVQFPYYATVGTTDADKLMYAKNASAATTYWLRTPLASYATNVRVCYSTTGGALSTTGAIFAYAVAPLAIMA